MIWDAVTLVWHYSDNEDHGNSVFIDKQGSNLTYELYGQNKIIDIHIIMRCHYNLVNFLPNRHNRQLIAHTWGWAMVCLCEYKFWFTLQLRHNGCDSVSNHQPHDCLLNRLFRRRSKKTSKLRVTGLCAGNSPGPVNSPQMASNAENVSIWWRHHMFYVCCCSASCSIILFWIA